MKLKKVLWVTFLTMSFLPIMLFTVVVWLAGIQKLNYIKTSYGIEKFDYQNMQNSMQLLSELTKKIHSELEQVAKEDPDKLCDLVYLSEVEKRLEKEASFLVVRKEDEYVYLGGDMEQESWYKYLPEYENVKKSELDNGLYVGGQMQALIKEIDFVDSEGVSGSAYIITKSEILVSLFRSFLVDILLAVFCVLVLTSGIATFWIYRSVSNPLKKLREATQNIKEGNLDFTLGVNRDDTIGELCADFEDMRKRLKQSTEEKLEYDTESKELISNISHDLKTPITAIKGYVEGIMDGVADTPEKMDRYIRTIYNKTNDMDRLINELTFYSKIDTNRIPYTFHRINVAGYFSDCVDEMSLELEAQNIKLQYFNYVDSDVKVIADAEQIKRVINNIVSNSIKYMDKEQGIIIIRIKDVGDFIQVEIEDNGKGIGVKELPYIFDRFYRTDASRNSKQGGSGIGLSIVKKIIEDHGGQIWANSKENTGTVMYFVLRKYQEVPVNE
ncbi:MAG: HAMP domain-containing histidine kinase [Lachnospiraceae bacterium]|nr:HAMP domain-containing histidine kinase [Lachnospiraceae bacterium]